MVAGPQTLPPRMGSEWVKGDKKSMLRILLSGVVGPIDVNGQKFNSVMPRHSHVADSEIAEIASFVRFAFGELQEKPVTPDNNFVSIRSWVDVETMACCARSKNVHARSSIYQHQGLRRSERLGYS